MNKPEQEFLDHLLYVRNYSKKTVSSYQEDIDLFCEFIFNEGVLMEDVDIICISEVVDISPSNLDSSL